jgi:hypothetical protein
MYVYEVFVVERDPRIGGQWNVTKWGTYQNEGKAQGIKEMLEQRTGRYAFLEREDVQ